MPVSSSQLLSRMADLNNQDIDRHAKVLIYGGFGAGKTSLAMWLAQSLLSSNGRIAMVDSSEGWVSLDNAPSLKENVIRLGYSEYGELVALAEAIHRKTKGFEHIEVVVIDEVDPIADDVLVTTVREKHGTPKGQQLPTIEGKDYRPMGDLMRTAIKAFEKAGVHLILVAHDTKRKDHRDVEITQPAITPKLKTSIAEMMHVIGYATAEIKGTNAAPEYVRSIQSLPTRLVEAKTRVGSLGKSVTVSHDYFVEAITDWVSSDQMEHDLAEPEEEIELLPDELPTDGIPVADNPDDVDDDEPAYAGSDD